MGRSPCCDAIMGLKKGPWTPEEDKKLVAYIQNHGQGSWRALPKLAGLNRCGKSCRLRWTNYLRPGIKRGRFSQEEEQTILSLHAVLGNKWSAIASYLPGRTDNEVKNFWNTHLKKKLIQQGYDPITHQPIAYDMILSTMPQLIAQANLNEFLDHEHYCWDNHHQNAAIVQEYASQMANFQCVQNYLMDPQSPSEAEANTSSTKTFMDMDTLNNLLCSFPSFLNNNNNNNSLSNSTHQFENTITSSSLTSNNFQLLTDDSNISFSHMPSLETPSAYESSPLSNIKGNMVQVPQSKALCSTPNSPWLLPCSSSATQSPSHHHHVVPLLTDNNMANDDYGASSSNWPDLLLLEDSLFKEIIS